MDIMEQFSEEKQCEYKGEIYSARDNGAIMRHAREGKIIRNLDNVWTFGNKNHETGYMQIGTERVHRIVAIAFHGKPPTTQHIVDHIDTNRCNNRPENLRWVTKLENALNNPITRRRIILSCCSIENFLKNPASLKVTGNKNFDWMRTVTKEEAVISKERLDAWAKSDKEPTGNGQLGDWVYKKPNTQFETEEPELITKSLTQNALQIDWRTSCEFPLCPQSPLENPLQEYLDNLKPGAIFSKNQYEYSVVVKADFNKEQTAVLVMTDFGEAAPKRSGLAKIEYDASAKLFYHESYGRFFDGRGAEKYFSIERGYEWTGGDVFDDFC